MVKKVSFENQAINTYGWMVVGKGQTPKRALFKFKSEALADAKASRLPRKNVVPVVISVCEVTPDHFTG